MSWAKDLTGEKIGLLQVLERKRENNRTYYYCKCDCGTEKWFRAETLNSNTPSCGCLGRFKPADIKNCRFGRLVAKQPTNKRDKYNASVIWLCECDCSNTAEVAEYRLVKNEIRSCGCLVKETSSTNGKIAGDKVKERCIDGTNVKNLTAKTPKNNTSGIKGVCWDRNRSRWIAQIRFKGKNYNLGRYYTKEEAAQARCIAEDKLFGEFLEWYRDNYKK